MRQPPSIDAFGDGGFRVSGARHDGSLLILDDQPLGWSGQVLADLTLDDFSAVIAAGPAVVEFVLLGTGASAGLPPRAVRDGLKAAGIGLEYMSTEGAARTYNILATQGRRIAAALIAV